MGEKIVYAIIAVFIMLNYGFLVNGVIRRIYARVGRRIGVPISVTEPCFTSDPSSG